MMTSGIFVTELRLYPPGNYLPNKQKMRLQPACVLYSEVKYEHGKGKTREILLSQSLELKHLFMRFLQ